MLVASIAFIVGIVSTWLILDSVFYERTDDAQIDGYIMPLTARINGQVQEVNAIEGQMVHAGDVLATIDQKEYSLAVYKAIASLAYAENAAAGLYFNAAITVTRAYGGLHYAQAAVKSAQARVAASEGKVRAIFRAPSSGVPLRLLVLQDTMSDWADLGSPSRVVDLLTHDAVQPAWLLRQQTAGDYALG